jgi:hypothetical protein
MKKYLFIMLLCLPILARADFYPEATTELESKQFWTKAYFKDGSDIGVMHFRIWFKHPPAEVFEVLTDTNSFHQKLSNYKDSRALTRKLYKKIIESKPHNQEEVVKVIGKNKISSFHNRQKEKNWTDYIFLDFNFPWPLKDRWVVNRVRVDESNSKKGEYKFEYKIEVGNFNTLFGYWKLMPVKGHPGWTEFRGRYESDPGVPVPKFVMKKAMVSGMKKDINTYRKILEQREKK